MNKGRGGGLFHVIITTHKKRGKLRQQKINSNDKTPKKIIKKKCPKNITLPLQYLHMDFYRL